MHSSAECRFTDSSWSFGNKTCPVAHMQMHEMKRRGSKSRLHTSVKRIQHHQYR